MAKKNPYRRAESVAEKIGNILLVVLVIASLGTVLIIYPIYTLATGGNGLEAFAFYIMIVVGIGLGALVGTLRNVWLKRKMEWDRKQRAAEREEKNADA